MGDLILGVVLQYMVFCFCYEICHIMQVDMDSFRICAAQCYYSCAGIA